MFVGLRDRLIRNRTQLANAIRGYAAEFGLTAAKGIVHLPPLLARIQADERTPGCSIVPYSKVYEAVALRALDHGCLIIAAAGNDSGRYSGRICPVISPASCPSIMAIGALDSTQQAVFNIADFSNRGINPNGGLIDVAAPGVFVYSSFPLPIMYHREDGTSMATPHVGGIAALLFEEDSTRGPLDVWNLISQKANPVGIDTRDVGAGLVHI